MKGKSYQNSETLAGQDLSGKDIRGTNFSGAILKGTNFSGVRAGQRFHWKIILTCLACVASMIAGGLLAVASSYTTMAFSADGIIVELAEAVWAEFASVVGRVESGQLETGINTTLVLPAVNITGWTIATFFILLLLFLGRLSRRGFAGIWRYLAGAVALLFVLWILSAFTMSVGIVQRFNSFSYFSLVGMAIAFGITAFLFTCITSSLATIVLAITLTATDSTGKGWVTGVLAILSGIIALLWTLLSTLPIMEEMKRQGVEPSTILWSVPVTIGVVILLSSSAAWVSWRTINRQPEFDWMRKLGLRCAAIGGTSFRGAILTGADFSGALLEQCDFRGADLTNVNWHQARALETARLGETYLSHSAIQQLAVTKQGQHKVYDQLEMVGLNLQNADLTDASFVATNCGQTNFRGAVMKGAQLVRTNLDRATLTNATLTGACINNWTIAPSTQLGSIICDFVYIETERFPNNKAIRIPSEGAFKRGEFSRYFSALAKSLQVSHSLKMQPEAVVASLRSLADESMRSRGSTHFEILAIEVAESQILLNIKFSDVITQSKYYQDKYYELYGGCLKGDVQPTETEQDAEVVKHLTELVARAKHGSQSIYMHNVKLVVGATEVYVRRQSTTASEKLSTDLNLSRQSDDSVSDSNNQNLDRLDEVRRIYIPEDVPESTMPADSESSKPDLGKSITEENRGQGQTFHDTALVSFSEAAYHGRNFVVGDQGSIIDASGSLNAGPIGNNYAPVSPSESAEKMELSKLLDRLVENVENSPVNKNDKRNIYEVVRVLRKALEHPQDEKAKEDAEYAVSRIQKLVPGIQNTIGFVADLTAVVPLITKLAASIFLLAL